MRAFSADNVEYSFTNVLFAHTAPKKHGVERYRVELYNPDVKSEVYETLYVDVSKDMDMIFAYALSLVSIKCFSARNRSELFARANFIALARFP